MQPVMLVVLGLAGGASGSRGMVIWLIEYYQDGNVLLVVIDAIVLITSVLVMLEAASAISAFRRIKASETRSVA